MPMTNTTPFGALADYVCQATEALGLPKPTRAQLRWARIKRYAKSTGQTVVSFCVVSLFTCAALAGILAVVGLATLVL